LADSGVTSVSIKDNCLDQLNDFQFLNSYPWSKLVHVATCLQEVLGSYSQSLELPSYCHRIRLQIQKNALSVNGNQSPEQDM
jgi:hypothetical protein